MTTSVGRLSSRSPRTPARAACTHHFTHQSPSPRHPGGLETARTASLSDGARRARTGDLLGAIQLRPFRPSSRLLANRLLSRDFVAFARRPVHACSRAFALLLWQKRDIERRSRPRNGRIVDVQKAWAGHDIVRGRLGREDARPNHRRRTWARLRGNKIDFSGGRNDALARARLVEPSVQ